MTLLDEDATAGEPRRGAGGRARMIERRAQWHDDPWDDPDEIDALVIERPRRSGRTAKTLVFTLGALLMVGVVALGAVGWWYVRIVNPTGDPGLPVNFTVEADDTLQTVSERLEADGLVSDASMFRWYVDHHDGLELTPGYYQIRPDDHMGNVMAVLSTPPSATFTQVTFPEGFTLARMAARLAQELPRLTAAEFIAASQSPEIPSAYRPAGVTSLEGLLFPDTYQVSNGESPGQLIDRMVALMERVGSQLNMETKAAQLNLTPYQVLIVASMIEREAKFDVDRPRIARVIYNRLFYGMPLGIDAALFYNQDPDLTFAEVKAIDSPYNTYLHLGLPPTPIANPGRASIEAALNPEAPLPPGDALCTGLAPGEPCALTYYVVSDEEGHHVFSVTLAQQEANIEKARAGGFL